MDKKKRMEEERQKFKDGGKKTNLKMKKETETFISVEMLLTRVRNYIGKVRMYFRMG